MNNEFRASIFAFASSLASEQNARSIDAKTIAGNRQYYMAKKRKAAKKKTTKKAAKKRR